MVLKNITIKTPFLPFPFPSVAGNKRFPPSPATSPPPAPNRRLGSGGRGQGGNMGTRTCSLPLLNNLVVERERSEDLCACEKRGGGKGKGT